MTVSPRNLVLSTILPHTPTSLTNTPPTPTVRFLQPTGSPSRLQVSFQPLIGALPPTARTGPQGPQRLPPPARPGSCTGFLHAQHITSASLGQHCPSLQRIANPRTSRQRMAPPAGLPSLLLVWHLLPAVSGIPSTPPSRACARPPWAIATDRARYLLPKPAVAAQTLTTTGQIATIIKGA